MQIVTVKILVVEIVTENIKTIIKVKVINHHWITIKTVQIIKIPQITKIRLPQFIVSQLVNIIKVQKDNVEF